MSLEMNMLTMHHVHHLSTEMDSQILTKVPKGTPNSTNQASSITLLYDVKYNWENNPIFS